MSAMASMAVFCGAILCASVVGGWLPTAVRMTHKRMEVALSFVAGMMLGIGLLHMLPHALGARFESAEGSHVDAHEVVEPVVMWVLGGFLVMFLLQRFFEFHHHEEVETADTPPLSPTVASAVGVTHSHEHEHGHGCSHDHGVVNKNGRGGARWMAAAVGMGVHSLLEGVALSAGFASHETAGHEPVNVWAGLGVFLVIVLHKPFDAMTLSTLMMQAGVRKGAMMAMSVGLGLLVALGAIGFGAGVTASADAGWMVSAALGLSAGTFLYISLSDLLPELQFHSHDRWKLTSALLLGIGLAWGMSRLEVKTHGHEDHAEQADIHVH